MPAYRYGGTIYSVHGLCKSLARRGNDVHVFTTNKDGAGDSPVLLGQPVNIDEVKVWYFPSNVLRRLYWSSLMVKALDEKVAEFDVVHLHSVFLHPTWAAAKASQKANIPYVFSPRGMLVKELIKRKSRLLKTVWISLIESNNLERASAIHVTSRIESKELNRFNFRLPHIVTIPNGIDLAEISSDYDKAPMNIKKLVDKKPFILFLGRINWKKGLDRLISSLPYVPDAHLLIVGNDEEDYQQTLESLADSHGVRGRITFTGPMYGLDKFFILRQASTLVLPSYSENFGNAVLEAMAVGCPVVVSPEVGVADVVQETGAGLVVESRANVLGETLRKLLVNPYLLKEMGERGARCVSEKFSWAVVADQMETAYGTVIGKKMNKNSAGFVV
jgi:glycosyltransferase involved in cell wall biosynthesis